MKKTLSTRRELLKSTVFSGAALATASLITGCSKTEAPATPSSPAATSQNGTDEPVEKVEAPYVDASSSKARALKYVDQASEAGNERADKGATKAAHQFCNNCQFYSEGNGEGGKCALFPGKQVKDQAWCVSWSLKAQS